VRRGDVVLGSLPPSDEIGTCESIFADYENPLAPGMIGEIWPRFCSATPGSRASETAAKQERELPARQLFRTPPGSVKVGSLCTPKR